MAEYVIVLLGDLAGGIEGGQCGGCALIPVPLPDGIEMGVADMAMPYLELIERGEVGTEELDDKVRRVLRITFRTAMNPY